ncbi:MAG: bifunctional transaldolase/phosoglucose isomerase [Acetobacter sp.]|nr:bifunctional transaldolase/phosoglucose isomerase [Acetobacter sp.]
MMRSFSPLHDLVHMQQSPWLDFISRSFMEEGSLAALVQAGDIRGVTSNPAIFQKAMGEGTAYDAQIRDILTRQTLSPGMLYERLAITDIREATKILAPVYDHTRGKDGFVSLEVSPYLAHNTHDTVREATRLWDDVAASNLMVKIPATPEGIPAIRQCIATGINVNVTLIFSRAVYRDVVEAWLTGLEERHAKGEDISRVASVASFFISRIDTRIDSVIDQRIKAGDTHAQELATLRGKIAIANAKQAYAYWQEVMQNPRWKALEAAGAQTQRLLWASTGTKDKAYSDVLYVDSLIGPQTVNTLPPATMEAFRDHGTVSETLTIGLDDAHHILLEAERLGLEIDDITDNLLNEGIRLFVEAFDTLLASVATKQIALMGTHLTCLEMSLPEEISSAIAQEKEKWCCEGIIRRLWKKDASLWTGNGESHWLNWLTIVGDRIDHLSELEDFQLEVRSRSFSDILLIGMGGSSLGPEVLAMTFGKREGFGKFHILDSTDPQQVAAIEKSLDIAHTLFIVSSKSGTTLEVRNMLAYFYNVAEHVLGAQANQHFIAITDPDSALEILARKKKFWKIFYGDKEIGGRFSVLSNFGLVPAAAMGLSLHRLMIEADRAVCLCDVSVPPVVNRGVYLGLLLGMAARFGRDKLTILATSKIKSFGAWLEQLVAESTGKQGKGIIPIDNEPMGDISHYGKDRLFLYLCLEKDHCYTQEKMIARFREAGHPVVTVTLHTCEQLAQEFFYWEMATAVAGILLEINPFDQPDVELNKIETRHLIQDYEKTGILPTEIPFSRLGSLSLFVDPKKAKYSHGEEALKLLKTHFSCVKPSDYVALLIYLPYKREIHLWADQLRVYLRDTLNVAVVVEFGPRFLHSTGQLYKAGPDIGVFLQITADTLYDLPIPGTRLTFGVIEATQALGDFNVMARRKKRIIRVHVHGDLKVGLTELTAALQTSLL